MTRTRGFTLWELMVVLSVTAALAGIAVMEHGAMRPGLQLLLAARQVAMDLQAARMRAVARNASQRLVFPDGADRYQAQAKGGSAYRDVGAPLRLPAGVVIAGCSARDAAIAFRPRGNASSFGTVTLRNRRGAVRAVVVDIAGRVRVQ